MPNGAGPAEITAWSMALPATRNRIGAKNADNANRSFNALRRTARGWTDLFQERLHHARSIRRRTRGHHNLRRSSRDSLHSQCAALHLAANQKVKKPLPMPYTQWMEGR